MGGVSKQILVVEDDIFIRDSILELLTGEGYEVSTAGNGQEAINLLRGAKTLPSLILLDLMMPVMNGWQFRTEQEQDVRLQNIPVVVVTAAGDAQQHAKQMKAEGWVKKPIEVNALLDIIQKCCVEGLRDA